MATNVVSHGVLDRAAEARSLAMWKPTRPILVLAASLYITPDVEIRLRPKEDSRNDLRASAAAAFDQFTEMGPLAHSLFADSWGRLGVAQLKVLSPNPGLRLIGGFVDPLNFVGIRLYWRDELNFKPTGQMGVIDYKLLGETVAVFWDEILPGIRRLPMKEF